MFSILRDLQLVKTLRSFHLIQDAVNKEQCDGFRTSVPVLAY
jgi:hypothetical protein